MAGLDPAIYVVGPCAFVYQSGSSGSAWMAGSSPAMTEKRAAVIVPAQSRVAIQIASREPALITADSAS
jgi:hypothetical protein